MVGVLNLRGVGGFAPGLWRANLCGVVRWRAELLCTSRGAPVTPFLIASGPNIKNRAKSLTAKEKIFSNRYFFGIFAATCAVGFRGESRSGGFWTFSDEKPAGRRRYKVNGEGNVARLPFGQTGGRYKVKRRSTARSGCATISAGLVSGALRSGRQLASFRSLGDARISAKLIGCAAIKNRCKSLKVKVEAIFNRLQMACFGARVLHISSAESDRGIVIVASWGAAVRSRTAGSQDESPGRAIRKQRAYRS